MTVITVVTLECDWCTAQFEAGLSTVVDARTAAMKQAWRHAVQDGLHVDWCAHCYMLRATEAAEAATKHLQGIALYVGGLLAVSEDTAGKVAEAAQELVTALVHASAVEAVNEAKGVGR